MHQTLSSTLSVGTHEFLRSTAFDARSGEFVMLRGPSGGGKTSLLNILGTIDRASGGRVGTAADWPIRHSLGTEILGRVVDEKSSDNFLAKLRLEKIGATLAGNFTAPH